MKCPYIWHTTAELDSEVSIEGHQMFSGVKLENCCRKMSEIGKHKHIGWVHTRQSTKARFLATFGLWSRKQTCLLYGRGRHGG